jgi:hypothetical protein
VTQGGLVSSERKVWPRYCDTRRRKGGKTGNTNIGLKPPGGRHGYKPEGEVPAEAVPGIGSGNSTLERGQSKRPRIAARRVAAPACSKGASEGEGPELC